MAEIKIGLGFLRTPEQEQELRDAAADLPDDWEVVVVGDPTTHLIDLRVTGPDVEGSKMCAPDGLNAAVQFLRGIKPPRA